MTRYYLSPLSHRFDSDIKAVVDQFFGGKPVVQFSPSIDVEESAESYNVRAEVPGLSDSDIDIFIEDEALVITGEKKSESEKKEDNRYYFESRSGSFRRELPLSEPVDEEAIVASLDKGILRISVPKKAEEEQPRKKIEIQVN